MDPIIVQASRVKHLSHDQLPPLADYDSAKVLIKRGFCVSCILVSVIGRLKNITLSISTRSLEHPNVIYSLGLSPSLDGP